MRLFGIDVALALDEARRLQMRSVAEQAAALQIQAQGVVSREIDGSIDSVAASLEARRRISRRRRLPTAS